MGLRGWCVGVGVLLVAGTGRAQAAERVAAAPTSEAAAVAPEPQDIRVGDVIMAPALEEPNVVAEREGDAARVKRRWYGAPILIGDGLAYACVLTAIVLEDETAYQVFLPPGLLGYALVGPITHAMRGNWGRAGLSVLSRAALPFGGLVAGASACRSDGGSCLEGVVTMTLVGMGVATVVDAALLASEPVPSAEKQAALEPLLSVGSRHAFVGAAGRF